MLTLYLFSLSEWVKTNQYAEHLSCDCKYPSMITFIYHKHIDDRPILRYCRNAVFFANGNKASESVLCGVAALYVHCVWLHACIH